MEIDESEGFSPEKDIFNRVEFGKNLMNLISNSEEELVMVLDAAWGEGKTTFVNMWRGLLNQNEFKSIYFDAFANDYQKDSFLTLASEIYSLFDKDDKIKTEFKSKAISALKILGRVTTRVGVKALTAGVLDESILDISDIVNYTSSEASKIADEYLAKQLESAKRDKQSLSEFKSFLENMATELGNDKPIVFIIDELDRCEPNFALDLIEKIKHLFSVPHLVFMLVMNRSQVEESIRHRFGVGVDSTKYLQKFVNVWATLPKKKIAKDDNDGDRGYFLINCLKRMDYDTETSNQQSLIPLYTQLIDYFGLSLREIERSLTNFAIFNNVTKQELKTEFKEIGVFLSIIKVNYPKVYNKLVDNRISYQDLIKETNLNNLSSGRWEKNLERHELKWVLKYYLSSDTERSAMIRDKAVPIDTSGRFVNMIPKICSWLESFKVQ